MNHKFLIIATLLALPLAAVAEKTAYLGIAMTDASPTLKEQLGISHGVVVADVADDSPAAGALKRHDILTRMNTRILVSTDQVEALLKSLKGGDRVTIEFLRAGKTDTIDVVLSEKEKKDHINPEAMPGVLIDPGNAQLFTNMGIDLKKLGINLNQIPGGAVNSQSSSSSSSSSVSSTVWSQNGTTYQVTNSNGNRNVRITEGGRVIYDGPCNTAADKAQIPAEFLKKIEEMQRNLLDIGDDKVLPGKPRRDK